MTFLIKAFVPRTPFAENLRVVIPSAQLAILPDELVAYAQRTARRAGNEVAVWTGEPLDDFLGKILDVEHGALVEDFGKGSLPSNSREHFDIAQRGDESVLVLGRKRAVDPFGDALGRNTDILTPVADANAARRPRHRNKARRDDAARLTGFGRGAKAARAG
jgi:hypothetical protein